MGSLSRGECSPPNLGTVAYMHIQSTNPSINVKKKLDVKLLEGLGTICDVLATSTCRVEFGSSAPFKKKKTTRFNNV